MAIAYAPLVFLVLLPTSYAVVYTVGNAAGWAQSVDYTTWVSGKTFQVGDQLLFTYRGNHRVDEVSKSDYDNCFSGNAIQSYSDGNTTISLSKTGSMYFICPTIGHCSGGMKLAVTVSAASTTLGTPTPRASPSNTPLSTPGNNSPASRNSNGATSSSSNMNFMVFGVVLYELMA